MRVSFARMKFLHELYYPGVKFSEGKFLEHKFSFRKFSATIWYALLKSLRYGVLLVPAWVAC